jgi:outer membrane lipoprotein-sorting protein
LEEAEEGGRRFYVVTIVEPAEGGALRLKRKAWFGRADLELVRLQFYEAEGLYVEDVHYSDYHDFQGISYPSRIEVVRPIEDYRLKITIRKATFNQPIEPEKFVLNKPEGAQLIDLTAKAQQENPRGQ